MSAPPPAEETWRLEDIFPSDESFRSEKRRVDAALAGLERFAGHLGDSAPALLQALEAITAESKALARLHAYASMKSDGDLRVASYQGMRQEVEIAHTEISRRTAYVRPEILALKDGVVAAFLAEEQRLSPFGPFLRNLIRQKAHVLTPAEENLLAEAGLVLGGSTQIFGILHNAEMPRETVTLEGGEQATLTPAVFSLVQDLGSSRRSRSVRPGLLRAVIEPSRGRTDRISSSASRRMCSGRASAGTTRASPRPWTATTSR